MAFSQASIKISLVNALTNQPVKNWPIQLKNTSIGYSQTFTTNNFGQAEVSGLSTTGSYTVTVPETDLYYSYESDPIKLRSNQNASLLLSIISKANQKLDAVEVKGSKTSRINTVNAEVSSELPAKEIQEIPVEGRDITRVLYRLPNVTRSTGFYPEAPNVSINGANALFTSYLIDGMDNNERFLGGQRFAIPVGMVKNVTVLANTYSAEYGQSANGLFDITTKSGSNETTGEVYYMIRPGQPLDSESPFANNDLYGRAVTDGFRRHQFGFAIGTPIVKDKTFLFLNAEQTIDDQENLLNIPQLNTNETIAGDNTQTLVSAKLDHYWSRKFRTSARVHYGLIDLSRRGGGNLEPIRFKEAGYTQSRNSFTAALNNVYTNKNFTSETNYQYASFDWLYLNPVNEDIPSVTVFGPDDDQVPIALLGETLGNFDLKQRVNQVQQKFTYTKGNHTFKAGFDFISSEHIDTRGSNGNGAYNVYLNQQQLEDVAALNLGADLSYTDLPENPDSVTYAVELRPETFNGRQNIFSAYLEDRWQATRKLTLTLGLRYDFDNLSKAGADGYDLNNIGPRFNANYAINQRSSLRGGYGIFYDKIVYAVYSDALAGSTQSPDFLRQLEAIRQQGALPSGADLQQVTAEGNATVSFQDQFGYLDGPTANDLDKALGYGFAGQRTILNPNGLDNPYAHHFTLGYQYQINNEVLFYVDAIYKASYNQLRLVDVNAPVPYNTDTITGAGGVRTQQEADASRTLPINYDSQGAYSVFQGDTLRNIARKVFMTDAGGEAQYAALNFNLIKDRGDDNFAYRISYTLSQLRNNTEDINFVAADANRFGEEWGPSLNDRTHVLNAMGYLYPCKGLALNVSALLQSGQPVNRVADAVEFGTADLNGDGGSNATQYTGPADRYPGESRNSDRLPWAFTLDLGVSYTLNLDEAKKHRLELRADVFNVLNTVNYSGYTSNFTQSNQAQVGPADSGRYLFLNADRPRQFQFSVRYLF
jgi:outer membrane receptor protein involved in Fe transport